MSANNYYVEFAKSGRSKCKKCKTPILKDELRIVTEAPGESFTTTVSVHPACFSLPRKYAQGAGKISAIDFVQGILEDRSEGATILPSQTEELAAAIESKAVKPKSDAGGGATEEESPVAWLKKAYEARTKGEDSDEPPTKKVKSDVSPSTMDRAVDLYGEYHHSKNDELKDILRWNRQIQTGNKDVLLYKVIDGALHGRLARCKLCGGRLKMQGTKVICSGAFDEASNRRIDCAYSANPDDAPRLQPWFTHEPSEEQNKEMDRLDAEAKGEEVSGAVDSDDVSQLKDAASKLDWVLTSREGLRTAAKDMVLLLQEHPGKQVDLPEDPQAQQQKVGQLIAVNKDKSAAELIPLIVSQFGFVEDKQKKADQKEAAIKTIVKNPANAGLVAAFQELAELYFKGGNANAGATYKKVINTLNELDFAVTEENAMGLCKGKTKVANIGKASADKIYEFVTTGTMAKLEEKRADAS